MGWRSLFFAPANRPDLLAKLSRVAADNYVVDLEDGTPLDHKVSARAMLGAHIAMLRATPLPGRLLVRINAIGTPFAADDVAALANCAVDGIVLPKLERAVDFEWLERRLVAIPRTDAMIVVGGIETIVGVLDARHCATASPRLKALYFGPEDLAAEAMIERTPGGDEVLYARQHVLLAARAANIGAIDQAVVDIHDTAAFEADSDRGRRFGYDGKICLNPTQVVAAHRFFTPDAVAVDRARRLLTAYAAGSARGFGTITFDGGMVDQPMVTRARAVLAAADLDGSG